MTPELIIAGLKQANSTMLLLRQVAEQIDETIPVEATPEILLELSNLRESLYLCDRDICAWLPRASRYDTPFNDDPAPWE